MEFENKVFIVTGASSGIGKSCAEQIISQGGTVIGFDKSEATIEDPLYAHCRIDITDEASASKCISCISDKYSHLDGLVNAAGIWGCGKPFYEMDTDAFERVVNVNTKGTFIMSKLASQIMIPQKHGKIVNISCIRASIFRGNMVDYVASKGAVVSMTSAMALDLAPYNIQVNSVAPGFTYTGMTAASFDNAAIREESVKLIPQGRLGMPQDISNVVMFLLSSGSDYITGTEICADGGYHIQK